MWLVCFKQYTKKSVFLLHIFARTLYLCVRVYKNVYRYGRFANSLTRSLSLSLSGGRVEVFLVVHLNLRRSVIRNANNMLRVRKVRVRVCVFLLCLGFLFVCARFPVSSLPNCKVSIRSSRLCLCTEHTVHRYTRTPRVCYYVCVCMNEQVSCENCCSLVALRECECERVLVLVGNAFATFI